MSEKLTIENFIQRANIKHNYKYDYSFVKYYNGRTKVKILCPVHGIFEQCPETHLDIRSINGCKLCGNDITKHKRSSNLDKFILKANNIHNNFYNYFKSKYINARTKLIITCPIHGEFYQEPFVHLRGSGCNKCGNEIIRTKSFSSVEVFIEKANIIHEFKFDYSRSFYITAKTKLIIICPIHGEFQQKPDTHLAGFGCRKCKSSSGQTAIRKILQKHNIKFEEEFKFDGCKYKRPLPFDFYLPKYNLCIEFDGEGHFEPVKYSNSITNEQSYYNMLKVQQRDMIKNTFCSKNKIRLIRIKYNEFSVKNFETILNQYNLLFVD